MTYFRGKLSDQNGAIIIPLVIAVLVGLAITVFIVLKNYSLIPGIRYEDEEASARTFDFNPFKTLPPEEDDATEPTPEPSEEESDPSIGLVSDPADPADPSLISEANNGCPLQKTPEECEARGCVNDKESCYWSTKYNECKKERDCDCGGCSDPGDEPVSNCDCSPAPDAERCAKVPLTGGAQKCENYSWNTGPGTAYCCDCGKYWTHYDKECCLPSDIVGVLTYDENWGWFEDKACGCPNNVDYCVK